MTTPTTPMPISQDFERLLRYLKALADQSRLRLLGLLATDERSVEELAALLNLKAPTISHHLALLKELELVQMRAAGTTHLYRLDGKGLGRIHQLLATPEQLAALAPPSAALAGAGGDAWERKVLRDFVAGERLKDIPAQEKKRLVILRWLADQFEWGHVYSEAEVNAVLKRHHPDAAALRRYLVGARLMDREHGTYWRIHSLEDATVRALAAAFTWGTLYMEDEVNDLLRRALPDHAPGTLRRDLIGRGLLETKQGRYWRTQPPLPEEAGESRGAAEEEPDA
jgi:DNA-binding transcriptional ArsR family regulator